MLLVLQVRHAGGRGCLNILSRSCDCVCETPSIPFASVWQDLVHKHKILRRLGKALSTAVQLLLPQGKQQHKHKQQPSQQHSRDKAASLVMLLLASLTMFVQAWTASATSTQLEADQLQVALQVTQSGELTAGDAPLAVSQHILGCVPST